GISPRSLGIWDLGFGIWIGRFGICRRAHGNEVTVTGAVDFETGVADGAVNQSAIGFAAMLGVEGDRGQPIAVIGFPLVDLAVSIGIFFGGDEDIVLIALRPIDLPVAAGRDVDMIDGAVRTVVKPCVFLPVVRSREANLLDLLVGTVVFPAI